MLANSQTGYWITVFRDTARSTALGCRAYDLNQPRRILCGMILPFSSSFFFRLHFVRSSLR